jgi:hypothetical protein
MTSSYFSPFRGVPSGTKRYTPTCRSFTTTMSQLKICDFSGETFKDFEELYFL